MSKLAAEVVKHSSTPAFSAWVEFITQCIKDDTDKLIYASVADIQEIQGGIKKLRALLTDVAPSPVRENKTGGI